MLKPAIEGAGVAAGEKSSAVVEIGMQMLRSKSLDQTLQSNCATVNGLAQLKRADEVAALRGISALDLA